MVTKTLMQNGSYRIQLDYIFEGPMDLLVYLIKKNEVDIYDIPIAIITDQYLDYLKWIKSMNIDLAGDFIVLASTLTQIKSKMLLPVTKEENEEDPRLEIIRPLMEYLQMKAAAEDLVKRNILGENTFIRNPVKEDSLKAEDEDSETIHIGLFELINAFQKILENISPDEQVKITADRISVKERITQIIDILEKKRSITFKELFYTDADKSEIVVTFLAILEMVKLALVRIIQHVQTGIIRIFYI